MNLNRTWDITTDIRINTLHHDVQLPATTFINDVESQLNIKLRVTQAYRSIQQQNQLYAKGRTMPGAVVSHARGGYSYHNYGLALDVVEIRDNEANWDTDWDAIARIAKQHGFEWGGDWSDFVDKPHFQMRLGFTIEDLIKENLEPHRFAQSKGRGGVFESYRLRVAGLIRGYGKDMRDEAPKDNITKHG